MSGRPVCPQCSGDVESDWDWCHHCGFDPEGKRAAYEASLDSGGSAGMAVPPSIAPMSSMPSMPSMPSGGSAFPGAPPPGGTGLPAPGSRGFGDSLDDIDEGDDAHPYDDLPYSQGAASSMPPPPPPPPPVADFPPIVAPDSGFDAPSGYRPEPVAGGYSPAPSYGSGYSPAPSFDAPSGYRPEPVAGGFGPAPSSGSGYGGPPPPDDDLDTGPPPSRPSFNPAGAGSGGFTPGGFVPAGPVGPGGPGGPGAPGWGPGGAGVTSAGAPAAGNNSAKMAIIGVVGVLVVVVLGVGLVKIAATTSTASGDTATTLDPTAPKPMGEVSGKTFTPSSGGATNTTTGGPRTYPKPTDGWVTYVAPDGTFQIEFPARPEVTSAQDTVGGVFLTAIEISYLVGTEGGGYDAFYYDLPSASIYADSQAAFDKLNESSETKREMVTMHQVDGIPSVQYTRTFEGKTEKGFVFIKGARIYQVFTIDIADADFVRFANSFHALK